MKRLVKRILGVMVIASMLFSTMPVTNASAATGYHQSAMISACKLCKTKNISYGVMRDFRGTSQTFHEGQYCEGCGKTVPLGESHYYYTTEDRFSFTCSKCGHDYYDFSETILAEHTIIKK